MNQPKSVHPEDLEDFKQVVAEFLKRISIEGDFFAAELTVNCTDSGPKYYFAKIGEKGCVSYYGYKPGWQCVYTPWEVGIVEGMGEGAQGEGGSLWEAYRDLWDVKEGGGT